MAETTTKTYTIRHATESDVDEILNMINELATYEKALHEVQATKETLLATLSFPSNPHHGFAKTLLISPATNPKQVAGMALYFHNYSTWRAAPGIFLEDLFVRPEFRKMGFGKALLQGLARECTKLDCKRLEWNVLKWNEPSIRFYVSDGVGAKELDEWVGMRVDGEGLVRLAGSGVDR